VSWFEDAEEKWLGRAKELGCQFPSDFVCWEDVIGDSILYINKLRSWVLQKEEEENMAKKFKMKYDITIKNLVGNEQLRFSIPADNAALALGKISAGAMKIDVPHHTNKGKLMKAPFLPNGEWQIVSVEYPGRNYDEMIGVAI